MKKKKKNLHWSKIQIGQTKSILRKNRKEIYLKDLFPIFFYNSPVIFKNRLLYYTKSYTYFIYTLLHLSFF